MYIKTIKGRIVDIKNGTIFNGELIHSGGIIQEIRSCKNTPNQYILPGFIDSHIHIESTMLTPLEFSKVAVRHGTTSVISDPHEIVNILGKKGFDFMLKDAAFSPMKFYFGVPSCVPATNFETSGAALNIDDIKEMLQRKDTWFLSEMMNFPGVINNDKETLEKIKAAHSVNKPIDGHAPGVRGNALKKYASHHITTDHEVDNMIEALEKIKYGMNIQIREGSAAKNLDTLYHLINKFPARIMFCTDDLHPDDLIKGHINALVAKAVKKGSDVYKTLRAACYNPIEHYHLPGGLLEIGDKADIVVVNNLTDFQVKQTFIDGKCVFADKKVYINKNHEKKINRSTGISLEEKEIKVQAKGKKIKVIVAEDKSLITKTKVVKAKIQNRIVQPDSENDILKLVVFNRYKRKKPAVAFISGFKLTQGAIASSVAHDSHNFIAVGTNDKDIIQAINILIKRKGGIAISNKDYTNNIPLPVAGLMTYRNKEGNYIAQRYKNVNDYVKKDLGTTLSAPFMTLSFMSLLVIPELKLSDKGLFDASKFQFTELFDD